MDRGVLAYIDNLISSNPHLTPEQLVKQVNEHVTFYRQQAEKHINKSMDHKLGVVHGFYNAIDEDIKGNSAVLDGKIQCKKGCAHCCKIKVEVSLCEAQYLLHYCNENGIEIDVDYLKEQAKLNVNDYAFSKYRNCYFLDTDNTCMVYDARPSACRRYLVSSDPKHCEYFGDKQQVTSLIIMDVDMKCFGLMSADSDNGTLPEMLLKAIELDGR